MLEASCSKMSPLEVHTFYIRMIKNEAVEKNQNSEFDFYAMKTNYNFTATQ